MSKHVGASIAIIFFTMIVCLLRLGSVHENISTEFDVVDTTDVTEMTNSAPSTDFEEMNEVIVSSAAENLEDFSTMKEPITSEPPVESESVQSTEDDFWEVSKLVYPVATEIWLQMKSYGWTDAACAGIMGNIMRESGGDMLSWIDPDARYNGHYGLCQWSYKYYQDIHPHDGWAPSIFEQIEYLRYTIVNKKVLHYDYNFDEEYLKTVTDYREAARIFHEEYEVSGASSVPRQNNAQDAWDWFVLRTEYNNNWLIQK